MTNIQPYAYNQSRNTTMLNFRHQLAGSIAVLLLTLGMGAWAGPMVQFGVQDIGGGFFQYNLTLNNQGGTEPLSGLLVLNGGSVFALDSSSNIGAPQDVGGNPAADWSFLSPFPPFVDILSYFSLDPAADVPVNASLGGFFFQSSTSPFALSSGDFAVVGIGAITASQIPLGDALFVPEPASVLLLIPALWIGTAMRKRRHAAIRACNRSRTA